MWQYWEAYLDGALAVVALGVFGALWWKRKLSRLNGFFFIALALVGVGFAVTDTQAVRQANQLRARLPQAAHIHRVERVPFYGSHAYIEVGGCRVVVEYDLDQAYPLNLSTLYVNRRYGNRCAVSNEELRQLLGQ